MLPSIRDEVYKPKSYEGKEKYFHLQGLKKKIPYFYENAFMTLLSQFDFDCLLLGWILIKSYSYILYLFCRAEKSSRVSSKD